MKMSILIHVVAALVLAGCQREGSTPKAGDQIDEAIEKPRK
jgi:hypothetical protein